MTRSLFWLFYVLLFTTCKVLQKTDYKEETLFTINGNPTLADEFLYVYEKNNFNNDSIYTDKDVDNYFKLFVNFKLKVTEAIAMGMDTSAAFISEFETYKDQLIKPYLSESQAQEELVREAYVRMKYEIDASHILVTVSPDALPEDTIKAYQKIMEVHEKAKSGEDFGALAVQYSEDPSAKTNNGKLGYFTTFQMVYPFEEAAYNTEIDSISDILRTRFGYHIMKVHDKRPNTGKVKVSHIMLSTTDNQSDISTLRNKIFEIHEQIMGGADWDEMCQRFSDDQRTRNNGGTLPFIGIRQINDPAFEEVAFSLQAPGEISDPVKSRFGWHILKLEEKQGLASFEELKPELKQRVSKDERSSISKNVIISNMKDQNQFRENIEIREAILTEMDSSILSGKWNKNIKEELLHDTLFFIDSNPYLVDPLIDEIKKEQKRRTGISPESYMNELIDAYIAKCLYDYEEKQLIAGNRDFRMLLNEYYEGILLFEIMNQKVWGKASLDTIGLQNYFDTHQESYYWGKRVDAIILTSGNENTIQDVKKIMNSEQFVLTEIELDQTNNIDILEDMRLDSLANLMHTYDQTSIIIQTDSSALTNKLHEKIVQFFIDFDVPADAIVTQKIEGLGKILRLTLNSKSKKSLEFLYNRESALNLQVDEGLFERGDNQFIDSLQWEKGTFEIELNDQHTIVMIKDVLEKQPKKLKDVKGLVISGYQDYLEKKWIEHLRQNNRIEINEVTFDKIKKAYSKKLNTCG